MTSAYHIVSFNVTTCITCTNILFENSPILLFNTPVIVMLNRRTRVGIKPRASCPGIRYSTAKAPHKYEGGISSEAILFANVPKIECQVQASRDILLQTILCLFTVLPRPAVYL